MGKECSGGYAKPKKWLQMGGGEGAAQRRETRDTDSIGSLEDTRGGASAVRRGWEVKRSLLGFFVRRVMVG